MRRMAGRSTGLVGDPRVHVILFERIIANSVSGGRAKKDLHGDKL
jgi:hypothetical protein